MRAIYTMPASVGRNLPPPSFMPAGVESAVTADGLFAVPVPGNLLEAPADLARLAAKEHGRSLLWSGWFEADSDLDALPSPVTWSPRAWSCLDEFCTGAAAHVLESAAAPNSQVCLLPRAGDLLSDLPSCQRFLQRRSHWAGASADRFELLLDPVGMLTMEMHPYAAEHVERIVLGLGAAAGVSGIVLSNILPGESAAFRQPVHRGVIPIQLLRSLLAEGCDPSLPIMLMNEDVATQLEALGLS
ncbi:MAG: hypothetical protein H7210_02480 [Pyrinomonadaceae bacterium]|nr:hypothetical protein [Phycisphaerales bacterium]